jgi:catechol 2,3-dioxygenase-like lactoylglutathione lyase family enzyme
MDVTIQRLENVRIVVEDLEAATALFVELGLEVLGEAPVQGDWVDRVVGLDGVQVDVAMLRTPDGHGRLELRDFAAPSARLQGVGEEADPGVGVEGVHDGTS